MIRVFPRRTKWTPVDPLAFVGDPPLWIPPEQPVRVSCTFTWDKPEAERLVRSWSRFYPDVQVGGPAYDDPGQEFTPGRFVRDGVTITSRGCIRNCPFCFVPEREGKIRELPIVDGWNVFDNNLLACSTSHIKSVFEMLGRQPKPIEFSGGIDIRIFNGWHRELLDTIRLKYVFFACDSKKELKELERVSRLMESVSVEKKRCYVLIGYDPYETLQDAEKRLEEVYAMGFLPFAMLYKPKDRDIKWNNDWL